MDKTKLEGNETTVKVSFIVPVFNIEETLIRRCVDSITNQTCSGFEIILVDDGSDEASARACDRISNDDFNGKIFVIHQENLGLSAARNTGVHNASGRYVTFVDPDDWVANDFLEKLYPKDNNFPDVVIGKIQKDYPREQIFYRYPFYDGQIFRIADKSKLLQLLLNYDSHIYDAPGKLIRREVLLENSVFHDPELSQGAEGLEFNFRLFKVISSCIFRDCFVYHYCYTSNSITTTPSERNDTLIVNCFMKIYKEIENSDNIEPNAKMDLKRSWSSRFEIALSAILIGSIFNPISEASWKSRKARALRLKVTDAYQLMLSLSTSRDSVGIARKIALYSFKRDLYTVIALIARIRYEQKRILSR
ncbi:glycosyltransferase family 2 protein [Lacticaseibacillus suilingensis]|uniref:Glycosyltransferase family 2 protein n=1 Tax=Lacticaseibacillus suilingensis TaxID=2799577 RepID=A0ABW4BH59_9LACO|nr:glycosyltransferase family 2 protein [Lacticaseibacillus suilingensis]